MGKALYVEEGADRSGGHCIKRRARTGEEGDVRSGGPACTVKRAPTCQEGAEHRWCQSGGRCTVRRTLYSEGTDRSGRRCTVMSMRALTGQPGGR